MFNPPERVLLTEEQKRESRKKTQHEYYKNKKESITNLQTTIAELNGRVGQYNIYIGTLTNERDQARLLLQSQSQLINEKDKRIQSLQEEIERLFSNKQTCYLPQSENTDLHRQISQLQTQNSEKDSTISNLNQNNRLLQQQISEKDQTTLQLQNQKFQLETQNSEKDSIINQLKIRETEDNQIINNLEASESQLKNQDSEKDSAIFNLNQTIYQLQIQEAGRIQSINRLESSESQLRNQNVEKDIFINQLQTRLNNCVTTDVDKRLQEVTRVLEDKVQQEQLCLQTINKLNSENSSLKIFRDLVADINSRYPKILTSYISEIQKPNHQSQYPEINKWAQQQAGGILPEQVVSLAPFSNIPSGQNTPQVVSSENISEPGTPIPQVSIQNIKHQTANDPDFQRWMYLYNNNLKKTNEYNNLYQVLRRRYGMSPIEIVKQYG
jgi:chromosome segregation ATPase